MMSLLRAWAKESAIVTWYCEDPDCPGDHIEEAALVNDSNEWLFFALANPNDDDPTARLLPARKVARVDFPSLTVDASADGVVWERDIPVLDKTEIEAGLLEPEMFNGKEPH